MLVSAHKDQSINKHFFYSSDCLLVLLLLIKLAATCFAVFVYAKFSPFPDAERYLNAPVKSWDFSLLFNRTLFTYFVYAGLKYILVSNLIVHLFVSTVLAFILWYVLKSEYHYINKPLLVGCLCLPHFLIWSGIVGKEALAIAGLLLIVKVCVDLVVWNKLKPVALFVGLFISLIERPHYAVAYIYLFLISLIITKSKIKLMGLFTINQSFFILFFVMAYLLVSYCYLHPFSSSELMSFMMNTQSKFLNFTQSATNRWDIVWDQSSDFFLNMYWGLPISIIGPTMSEALARPVLLPAFIEGCFCLFLMIVILYQFLHLIKINSRYSSLFIWGYLPALLFGLLINYPFGIFNPGSAIRYKQSLTPLFYIYPLLLLGAIRRKSHQETS